MYECECISSFFMAFTWRLIRNDGKREKTNEERMQKSQRDGRFENKIFKFRETAMSIHTNTHTHTYGTACVGNIDMVRCVVHGIGMQSENEMCVRIRVECGSDSHRSLFFFLFFRIVSALRMCTRPFDKKLTCLYYRLVHF